MTGFTHYSLFQGYKTLRDFAPLPSDGLPVLLAELHRKVLADKPNYCCGIGEGVLHPDGEQMSFTITIRTEEKYSVILYTQQACRDQAIELFSEGNASAELAAQASHLIDTRKDGDA